jgi:hypothetical protein
MGNLGSYLGDELVEEVQPICGRKGERIRVRLL